MPIKCARSSSRPWVWLGATRLANPLPRRTTWWPAASISATWMPLTRLSRGAFVRLLVALVRRNKRRFSLLWDGLQGVELPGGHPGGNEWDDDAPDEGPLARAQGH